MRSRFTKQRLVDNPRLKPGAKLYREKCIATLLGTWPGLLETDIRTDTRLWGSRDANQNGKFRTVPMISEMKELLGGIKERRGNKYDGEVDQLVQRIANRWHEIERQLVPK